MRGSLSVNPWKVEAVAEAISKAVMASEKEKVTWHEVRIMSVDFTQNLFRSIYLLKNP